MKKKIERKIQENQNRNKKNLQLFNKRASFEVAVEEKLEAGVVLTGDEIKSIRANRMQMNGAFIKFMGQTVETPIGHPVLVGLNLSGVENADRSRDLLLNRKEIDRLKESLAVKGKTAVPLRLYFVRGWVKIEIGVGKGRKQYQKRELLKERDLQVEQDRWMKGSGKSTG